MYWCGAKGANVPADAEVEDEEADGESEDVPHGWTDTTRRQHEAQTDSTHQAEQLRRDIVDLKHTQ